MKFNNYFIKKFWNKMIYLHEKQGHFYRWKIKPIRPNPIELHLVIQSKQSVSLILIKDIFIFAIQL
jgi:hypothetical protein